MEIDKKATNKQYLTSLFMTVREMLDELESMNGKSNEDNKDEDINLFNYDKVCNSNGGNGSGNSKDCDDILYEVDEELLNKKLMYILKPPAMHVEELNKIIGNIEKTLVGNIGVTDTELLIFLGDKDMDALNMNDNTIYQMTRYLDMLKEDNSIHVELTILKIHSEDSLDTDTGLTNKDPYKIVMLAAIQDIDTNELHTIFKVTYDKPLNIVEDIDTISSMYLVTKLNVYNAEVS